jgi:hypothetical protein
MVFQPFAIGGEVFPRGTLATFFPFFVRVLLTDADVYALRLCSRLKDICHGVLAVSVAVAGD